MKRTILLTAFYCLFGSMATAQDWVSFTRSTPQAPVINLTQSSNQQVSFTVEVCGMFKNDTSEGGDTYQRIHIPGAGRKNEIGEPELPFIRQLIAIPECDSVSLAVNITGQTNYNNYNIYPAPDFMEVQNPDSTVYMQEVFAFDSLAYSQNNYIPGQNAEIISTGYLRDQKFAEVLIYPINFNPATNHINVMTNYSLTLDFYNPSTAVNINTGIFNNVVSCNLLNYTSSGIKASVNDNLQGNGNVQWITLTDTSDADNIIADYLIIVAHPFFEPSNPASEVLRIANHRATYNGFDVAILDANEIYLELDFEFENPDFEYEQKIRSCIHRVYEGANAEHMYDGKLGYVLLVGDTEYGTNTGMPTSYEYFSFPSDYYYSCVTKDGNVYDKFGDLYIGRFGVDNNLQNGLTELHNIVEKTIYFESEYSFEDWRNNVAHANGNSYVPEYFIAEDEDDLDYYDFIADLLFEEDLTIVNYYTLDSQIYQPVIDMLNEGTPVMLYDGHGQYNNWQDGLSIDELETNLTNSGKFPYVTSRACLTGYLDKMEGDCMGEALTTYSDEKGFVGFLGASRKHFQEGGGSLHEIERPPKYIQERIPYSIWNDLSFVTGEFILESKIGIDAIGAAFIYNYFGDPALNIMAQGFEITHDVTLSDTTTISTEVTVTNNAILTIPTNGQLFFENEGVLIIDAGATLVLEDNISIIATNESNKLQVYGELQVGDNISFSAEGENLFEIIIVNTSLSVSFDYSTFQNTFFNCESNSLSILNSDLTFSAVQQTTGDLNVLFSTLNNSSVKAVNTFPNIENSFVIAQNSFTNGFPTTNAIVEVDGYTNYLIEENTIQNDISTLGLFYGISVSNSGGDRLHYYKIEDNSIVSTTACGNQAPCAIGLTVFSSYAEITNNIIKDNDVGIEILHNSITEISGNKNASFEDETQLIKNNSKYQVFISSTAFPTNFHWNAIYEDSYSLYFIFRHIVPGGIYPKADVRYNYWGMYFNANINLYPLNHYGYEPTWNLGGGSPINQTDAGQLYLNAINQVADSTFVIAKSTFQQVVITYPETDFAKSSMRELLNLEPLADNNFSVLKNWYLTEPVIQNNDLLKKIGNDLAAKCDERLENYSDAITWYESVIENPETLEDSIFAIIDLEHVYLQMGIDTNLRSGNYIGRMPQYKPVSIKAHQKHRDELLALLLKHQGQNNASEDDIDNDVLSQSGLLFQNAPNPFKGSTQIPYKLKNSADVKLHIYSYTGQLIKTINIGIKSKGTHSIEFDASGLKSGLYFYSICINGQNTDSRKMTILN